MAVALIEAAAAAEAAVICAQQPAWHNAQALLYLRTLRRARAERIDVCMLGKGSRCCLKHAKQEPGEAFTAPRALWLQNACAWGVGGASGSLSVRGSITLHVI